MKTTQLVVVSPTFSGPIGWTPIQSSMPPTVVVQPRPDYATNFSNGVAGTVNAVKQYLEAQPRKNAAQVSPAVTKACVTVDGALYCKEANETQEVVRITPFVEYLRDTKGRPIKCTTYGENSFCESIK